MNNMNMKWTETESVPSKIEGVYVKLEGLLQEMINSDFYEEQDVKAFSEMFAHMTNICFTKKVYKLMQEDIETQQEHGTKLWNDISESRPQETESPFSKWCKDVLSGE